MSSLPDGLSVGALIVAGISGCFMFMKTIKKCKFSRSQGFELEREIEKEKDIVNQQEFMLNLIRTIKTENLKQIHSPREHTLSTTHVRRCASDDSLPWNTSSKQQPITLLYPTSKQPLINPNSKQPPINPNSNNQQHTVQLNNSFIQPDFGPRKEQIIPPPSRNPKLHIEDIPSNSKPLYNSFIVKK